MNHKCGEGVLGVDRYGAHYKSERAKYSTCGLSSFFYRASPTCIVCVLANKVRVPIDLQLTYRNSKPQPLRISPPLQEPMLRCKQV